MIYRLQVPPVGAPRVRFDLMKQQFVTSATDNAPVFKSTPPAGPAVVGLPFTYQAVATDQDGDKLTYSVDSASAALGVTIDPNTGLLKWTPTATSSSTTITVSVTDNRSPAVTQPVAARRRGWLDGARAANHDHERAGAGHGELRVAGANRRHRRPGLRSDGGSHSRCAAPGDASAARNACKR